MVIAYRKGERVFQLVKMLFALPLLPAAHISPAFEYLKEKSDDSDATQQLLSYIFKNWITSSLWPVEAWSVYKEPIRTNNDVEGWHRRINSRAAKSQLPFYMLITLLHNEAVWLTVQVNLLSANNLKTYQRKKYRQMQGKIFALWEMYEEENITTSSFLSRAAHLYRPTVS